MKRGATLLAALLAVAACTARSPSPAARVVAPTAAHSIADELILTFWCGPPLPDFTDARAAEIAAAGFNVVGATCEGPFNEELNKRALAIAARHGLRMFIKDKRLSAHNPLREGWQKDASAAIAAYRDHPGLAGFFLVDEPVPDQFDDVAALTRRIQREAPGALAYVNLLPDYALEGATSAYGYRDYLEDFVQRVRPRLLSYDHYPFLAESDDRPSFFANLTTVRDVARDYDLPFLLVVLAMPHGEYRDPSEAEISWQALQALAFGARGISYFAYWTPVGVRDFFGLRFRHGLIEGGVATRHYAEVARLNTRMRTFATALAGRRAVAAHDSAGRFGDPLPAGPLLGLDGDPVTAGCFRAADGSTAVLLVNQSYRDTATTRPRLAAGAPAPRVLDARDGTWSVATSSLTLPPGGALLLQW